MKILKHLIAFAFILGMSSMASAAIPPPPVNQNLGIPDTSFSNFDQTLCQACHWASYRGIPTLSGAPVKKGYNPNRHHLAVGTEIDGKPEFPPFRDSDGDGQNDTHFNCLNCHIVVTEGVDIETAILADVIVYNYRNCLNCHSRDAGPLTVHHATDLAQTGFCFRCHGGLVRGIDVDTVTGKKPDPDNVGETVPVDIPTYSPSIITPWRSAKPNGDGSQKNHANTSPGNCNFCHNTAEGAPDGGNGAGTILGDEGGTMQVVNLPDGSTFNAPILTNAQNHHNTGFFEDNRCTWCHIIDGSFQTGGYAIRACQRCHDRTTLHNIEFDKDGDGVVAGGEEAYYGHIGNQKNCWGCHGNNKKVQDENGDWVDARDTLGVDIYSQGVVVSDEDNARISSVVKALIPTINSLSTQTVSSGVEATITIDGMNMVNSSLSKEYEYGEDGAILLDENRKPISQTITNTWTSEVVVTDKNNNNVVIVPDYQDTNKLEFTLPATLAPGFYQVSLKKEGHVSNPIGLTVTPAIAVRQAVVFTPYGGLVIMSGLNFMDALPNGMTYKLIDQDGNAPKRIYLWRDDFIIALFDNIPESVTVDNLYNEKTIPLTRY